METRRKGKAIIGIAIAAIMLASVFAATVPIVSAESRGDNFNHIVKEAEPQKVLIGQNLQFEGFDTAPVVYRFVYDDVENIYTADNNRIYNVNWPTSGAYYVNYVTGIPATYDAQLSVETPDMPLELKDVDTMLIVDTTRINLFPQDLVDLVIIGPAGQIKIDKMNNQTFTNITVSQLMLFCDAGLKTEGWKVGNYTFQVKTRSANACGLKAASVIRILEILKDGDFIIIQHVHNINTGENFSSIQAAIDDNDTDDGHTITVDAGTYYENVVVDKSVTLRGIGHPVVDGGGKRNAITLTADGITLAGFNATNSGSSWGDVGIKVTSNNNTITGNNVSNNNWDGITLSDANNNTITGNNVSNNNVEGIRLSDSSNNRITGNNICNNGGRGIRLDDSSNNTIIGNTFVNDGLSVRDSYQNTVEDNIVNDKPLVYLENALDFKVEDAGQVIIVNCNNITIENLDLSNTSGGIALWKTENSKISNNTACNNWGGIRLDDSSSNNRITGNNVCSNNVEGIRLDNSSNNFITGNNVCNNNEEGIRLDDSSNNFITGNNVSNNNEEGIRLYLSSNNSITGNNVSNNNEEGIRLWDSSNNFITGNNVSNNNEEGIRFWDSSNNFITGNNVSNNNEEGIRLYYSSNNSITGNNVSNNNVEGIRLYYSSNNSITGNNVSNNNEEGIRLSDSSNNSITGNNVSNNNWYGIRLSDSSNNTITGNVFVNDGLSVYSSYQNTVEDNIVNGKPLVYLEDVSDYKVEDAGQVILVNCSNITVENLDLTNTSVSIALLNTENSKISNNAVCNNNRGGIRLSSSSNNTITGNNVSSNNNRGGILLSSSSNNTITGNNVSNNNEGGIRLYYSSNNTITGNNVSNNNEEGIRLYLSSNNTITGNNVNNNNLGGIGLSPSSNNNTITGNVFVNDGLFVYFSYQNTVEDNTVNGKPLVYLEDVSDYEVEDAGQVILVNCSNITVENLDLTNTSVSIALLNTENSKISNNTVCNNNWGISLYYSSNNNTITGNNVSNNNRGGISLYYSSNNNTITGNNVSNNEEGLSLYYSSNNNTITGNNVSNNNEEGICLWDSSNNKIYFNNFINNTDDVDSYTSTNIWNTSKKITYTQNGSTYTNYLGNYWGDYEEKYPDAEEIDTTGIWDTSCRINSDNDNYPLMERFENYITP